MALELRGINLERMTGKQRLFALPAVGMLGHAFGGQAVDGLAVRADQVKMFAHDGLQ